MAGDDTVDQRIETYLTYQSGVELEIVNMQDAPGIGIVFLVPAWPATASVPANSFLQDKLAEPNRFGLEAY